MRLFAEQQLRARDLVSPREAAQARERFRDAYLAGSVKVLARLGVACLPALPYVVPDHWYPQVSGWDDKVAGKLEFWVRAEFGSLIRVVQDAARYGQRVACWQIAARLGDCFSPPARHADVRRAFGMALAAARENPDPRAAEIQVRLAKSGYLAAVHDYSDAIAELDIVAALAEGQGDHAAKVEALRRLAHACHEIADYDRALRALQDGPSGAIRGLGRESRLIELLRGENKAVREPGHWMRSPSIDGLRADLRDNSQFIERIILGRVACRRREDQACRKELTDAWRFSSENLAHARDIEHEQAATSLHRAVSAALAANSPGGRDARSVTSLAAQAVRSSDRLDRPHARAQARCTLAHALVQAGQTEDCFMQLESAEQIAETLPLDEAQRLNVRIQRVRGEALLDTGKAREALAVLEPAERWLAQRESWAHAEILVLQGAAHREVGQFGLALAAHATAAVVFSQHSDKAARDYALSELAATLRAAGAGRFSLWRMRRAIGRALP